MEVIAVPLGRRFPLPAHRRRFMSCSATFGHGPGVSPSFRCTSPESREESAARSTSRPSLPPASVRIRVLLRQPWRVRRTVENLAVDMLQGLAVTRGTSTPKPVEEHLSRCPVPAERSRPALGRIRQDQGTENVNVQAPRSSPARETRWTSSVPQSRPP